MEPSSEAPSPPTTPPPNPAIFRSADHAWISLLNDLIFRGLPFSPRNKKTLELVAYKRTFDMAFPVVTVAQRELGYKFMCAEAAWILTGRNDVKTIVQFSKRIAQFSDDGETFFGAYGPKVLDQLPYCASVLREDPWSRRAVINIWREKPENTKDYPCTLSLQFLLRGPYAHTVATMRSSDAWLGWPYDVFNFTMVTVALLLMLRDLGAPRLALGSLTLQAGSQHLYEENFEGTKLCAATPTPAFQYAACNPWDFQEPAHLVRHLWSLAKGEAVSCGWLQELPHVPKSLNSAAVH